MTMTVLNEENLTGVEDDRSCRDIGLMREFTMQISIGLEVWRSRTKSPQVTA